MTWPRPPLADLGLPRASLVSESGSAWQNAYSLSDMSWEIPLSLLLISTNWWENFCDKDLRLGCLHVPVKNYKDALHRVRTKAYILASLWKIGLTVGFAFLLVPDLTLAHEAFKVSGFFIELYVPVVFAALGFLCVRTVNKPVYVLFCSVLI